MLRTRLIVGSILAALTAGMLLLDRLFAPWFPFLAAVVLGLSTCGTLELWHLLPPGRRPRLVACLIGVIAVILSNWVPVVRHGGHACSPSDGLAFVSQGFAALVLLSFLVEMALFSGPGGAVERIALAVWVVAYLGLLPSFLVQLQ